MTKPKETRISFKFKNDDPALILMEYLIFIRSHGVNSRTDAVREMAKVIFSDMNVLNYQGENIDHEKLYKEFLKLREIRE